MVFGERQKDSDISHYREVRVLIIVTGDLVMDQAPDLRLGNYLADISWSTEGFGDIREVVLGSQYSTPHR